MRRIGLVLLLLGSSFSVACRKDGTIAIRRLTFVGASSVDVNLLRAAMATREGMTLQPPINRSRFDVDLQRIQAFYADLGFPDARLVDLVITTNPAQDAVDVRLKLSEGEPVRVAAVRFRGFETLPPEHLAAVQGRMPLVVGRPRERQAVLATQDAALNELRDHGYPYARVSVDENTGADGRSATVTLTAEPGVLAHFGAVDVVGSTSVGAAVIRRQLSFTRGEIYRRSQVQDTQRRLYAMELFQFVNIELLEPEQQLPEAAMRVTVAEGRHQRINGSVGYGSEEQGRVDGEYRHVNFLGGARSFGAHARWSSRDRGLRVDLNQPYVFTPALSLGAEAQRWYSVTPAYDSVVTGARVSLLRRTTSRTFWTVSVSSERNTSTIAEASLSNPRLYTDLIALGLDPTTGTQQGTLRTVTAELQRSTTDNILNARRGYHASVRVEDAGRLLPGTFSYASVAGDFRAFVPAGRRIVLASRVQFADIRPAGHDPALVPFSKKYFLGGATSLRGWGRYEVSPLGSSGLPIGGNALIELGTEIRAPLKGRTGGVLFLDAGDVWVDDRSIDLGTLRYSVGAGLRYQTLVGPIRFDVAYQLNPLDGLIVNGALQRRRWRFHFSIGQAF